MRARQCHCQELGGFIDIITEFFIDNGLELSTDSLVFMAASKDLWEKVGAAVEETWNRICFSRKGASGWACSGAEEKHAGLR